MPLPAAESSAPPQDELAEVLVQAPEPRYVAPTRRDRIGRVWVPVFINDKGPFRLVLDSGATHSAITQEVATALGIPMDSAPPVLLRGVTGTAMAAAIRADSLSVGELYVGPAMLPIVADAFGGAQGLLGTQGMEDKRIYIDFRNDFINISRSRNLRAARGFNTIRFLENSLRLIMVRAAIGDTPVLAIIDTGAESSVGNLALKARLTLMRRSMTRDEITGATGDTQQGESAPVSPVTIGDIVINNPHVTFADMPIFERWNLADEPVMLVGMDILGLLDTLIIDYKRKELHVKLRR